MTGWAEIVRSRCGAWAGSVFLRWLALPLAGAVLFGCRSNEGALDRGDRYWADSNFIAALAEYRLAAKQSASAEADARVAHAYAITGQLDRARKAYDLLLKVEPGFEDQAVFDYVTLARSSLQRSDRYGAARAAEAALALRPGLALPDLAPTLARHYATVGDAERALEFYHRSLGAGESASRGLLLYEIASLSERNGACVDALPYFRAFVEESTHQDSVTEARWRMGTCGLEQGRLAREAGQPARALELLDITLDLGAPQHLLDQAWFERGEALMMLGRNDEAASAFERVLELNVSRRTPLETRATRRLDEIRGGLVP